MTQLTNLPDLSRFLDEVKINDTVNLLIGEDTIQVNGIVISLVSKVLQDLAVKGTDLYLDEFVGDVDGVRDCVRFLYGGKVDITVDNIKTIVKFSIRFEVECLYRVCVQWIAQNLCTDNLFLCINIGIMVEGISEEKGEILTTCTCYIKDNIADDLVLVSENWSFDHGALIKFLIQGELLSFTLPLFALKIQSDNQMRMLVDDISESLANEEIVSRYKKEYSQLMELLSDKAGDLETSKRINKLACGIMNVEEERNLVSLVSRNYVTLSVSEIVKTEEGYDLEHFEYVEILMHWITHNRPSQADLDKLWNTIRDQELYYSYVYRLKCSLLAMTMPGDRFYMLPGVENRGDDYYQYSHRSNLEIKGEGLHYIDEAKLDSLLNKNEISFTLRKCQKCVQYGVTINFRLVDAMPCFRSEFQDSQQHKMKHCLLSILNDDEGRYYPSSLITNPVDSVIAMIKDTAITSVWLVCIFDCTNNKRRKTDSTNVLQLI